MVRRRKIRANFFFAARNGPTIILGKKRAGQTDPPQGLSA